MSVLDDIVAAKRRELEQRMRALPLSTLLEQPTIPTRDFASVLEMPGISAIAEIKRRSPSKGVLREELDAAGLAREYEVGGARALSVLTERDIFSGSDDDLRAGRASVGLPVLRKDFTLDAYQVHEARRLGADAILLIVRILTDAELRGLISLAHEIGIAALVETHDQRELDRALACGARIIGVNNRNLDTFDVSLETSLRLRPTIPTDRIAIAESGIHTRDDVRRLADASFDGILVGESLVRAADPAAKLAELLGSSA